MPKINKMLNRQKTGEDQGQVTEASVFAKEAVAPGGNSISKPVHFLW
ncbi:hypothetical protein [Flavihumibacter profundi]|nr:hypothetical protein [Flavihumibacter profundi]MBZ5855563.1 hypothetical protein [Flavihumibacter profundi]